MIMLEPVDLDASTIEAIQRPTCCSSRRCFGRR
jgi:hypothetical protein